MAGTPPNMRDKSFSYDETQAICRDMRTKGINHFRATQQNGVIYIDGWYVRPEQEAPFDILKHLT